MTTIQKLHALLQTGLAGQYPLTSDQQILIEKALHDQTVGPLLQHRGDLRTRLREEIHRESDEDACRTLLGLIDLLQPRSILETPRLWRAGEERIEAPVEWELGPFLDPNRLAQGVEEGKAHDRLGRQLKRFYSTATVFSRHHTLLLSVKERMEASSRPVDAIAVVGAGWDSHRDETYETFEWAALFENAVVTAFDQHEAIPRLLRPDSPSFVTVEPAFFEAFPDYGDYLRGFGVDPARLREGRFRVPSAIKERVRSHSLFLLDEPFPDQGFDIISLLMTFPLYGTGSVATLAERAFLLQLFSSLRPQGFLAMETQARPLFSEETLDLLGISSRHEEHTMLDIERRAPAGAKFTFYTRTRDSFLLKELAQSIRVALA